MHTCPPPTDALEEWLDEYPFVKETYGHLLLEQKSDITQQLIDALRSYFESAHLDARKHFHSQAVCHSMQCCKITHSVPPQIGFCF